ncbi:MAG: site-specific DNA-methyltransferase [Desulfobacteraceae bacterium]|nr:site-specific DNA-methyltransferase [Desulfobacteraceae bacterium]
MQTNHRIVIGNANQLTAVADQSIDLVVTSPPYPMIQMWDDIFCAADPAIKQMLQSSNVDDAFEAMHRLLDNTWKELRRVVKPGGIVCINIGDATRTIGGRFRLFGNHARIIAAFRELGLDQLPVIIWRKTTNAPNKFMGSGMYPPGAYVTLEHEYILIFRLGDMREFISPEQKQNRRESAYFWEERNIWFSDVWFDLIGTRQATNNNNKSRDRSAAYPFELPYRLIQMFSVKGDVVLDPFLGTGTTMLAAMAGGRHSIGYEIDQNFQSVILEKIAGLPKLANQVLTNRLEQHEKFIQERINKEKEIKHRNQYHLFPVVTRQEAELSFDWVEQIQFSGNDQVKVIYTKQAAAPAPLPDGPAKPPKKQSRKNQKPQQLEMF